MIMCVCVNQALPADVCIHRVVGLPTSLVHMPSYFVWFQPRYQQEQSRQLLQVRMPVKTTTSNSVVVWTAAQKILPYEKHHV